MKRFPNYSKSNIYIHANLPYETAKTDGRKLNKGRPKVFTVKDKRKIWDIYDYVDVERDIGLI